MSALNALRTNLFGYETSKREKVVVTKCSSFTVEPIVNGGLVADKVKSAFTLEILLFMFREFFPLLAFFARDLQR